MLKNFITDKYIRLDIECSNWEEAIRKSGEQLLKEKKVTEEYIEDAVNSVKELGPYIVVAKGIAVPHTSSHIGVKGDKPKIVGKEALDKGIVYISNCSNILFQNMEIYSEIKEENAAKGILVELSNEEGTEEVKTYHNITLKNGK